MAQMQKPQQPGRAQPGQGQQAKAQPGQSQQAKAQPVRSPQVNPQQGKTKKAAPAQPTKKHRGIVGSFFRFIVTITVIGALGVGAWLFYTYQKEHGGTLNLTKEEGRQWAADKLKGAVSKMSAQAIRSKEDIEKWLASQNQELPNTDELLKRAIAYLERPEPVTDPWDPKAYEAAHPIVTAPSPSPTPASAITKPVEPSKAVTATVKPAHETTVAPATVPATAISAKPNAPATEATAIGATCPLNDPNCGKSGTGVEKPASETSPVTPATTVVISEAIPLSDKPEPQPQTIEPVSTGVVEPVTETETVEEAVAPAPVAAPKSSRDSSPEYKQAGEHFRKGLEQYKLSTPGTPNEQKQIALAEVEFRKAQEAAGKYLDAHPDDQKAEEFFTEINRFLYDCMKRKTLDVR
jgi:hypothetical protein